MYGRLTMAAAAIVALLSAAATGKDPTPAEALRQAVTDLTETFGPKYPKGREYLARLAEIEKKDPAGTSPEWAALRKEALLANPLVSGQPLVYVVRAQYAPDHHNTETMFQTGECNTGSFHGPGQLKVIDLATGTARVLVDVPQGIARDPEIRWDAKKIVFSLRRNIQDDYHLYEVNPDGSGLTQLTFGPGVTDIDPFYLADGRIAFSSTRQPKYCMCNIHIMANLYVMDADGANVHQIGRSTLHEAHGTILSDGRLMYDRWEYVDRNFGDGQGLWTVNPDGTEHLGYYGINTPAPGGCIDAREIPGTGTVMAVLGSCHDRPWGALGIIDRRLGVDGRSPVVRTWPAGAIGLVRNPGEANGAWDQFGGVSPKYEDPMPLSEKYFLAARMTGQGEQMGLYLLDVFGNEILAHVEGAGCYDPQPLVARRPPPAIPARRNFENATGTFYVANVYEGTHMAGVKPGAVKSLRVVESPEKRHWTNPGWNGQGVERPAVNWHSFETKKILGTVPVEADGSAYFRVPADAFVYFQLLDEKGMMIQSMRSGTIVQSGETTGCIGCHDNRNMSAPIAKTSMPLAMRRPASELTGWHGPAREFGYLAEVQPVFDRHCNSCHDFGKKGAEKLVLAGDKNGAFNISYTQLWTRGYLRVVGGGPAETQRAYSWGSHASPLTQSIVKGHYDVKLGAEDFDRLVTWVDLNAVYYPSYGTNFPDNNYGRSPLTVAQQGELASLGVGDMDVCFDRPEMSPPLARLRGDNAKYARALAIIQAGKDTLAKDPRADMPGFTLCETDRNREAKYARREQVERQNREAIRGGKKFYESAATQPAGATTGR